MSAQPYPCPVAEGEHQRNQSGFQFSQGCQVIGGKTSDIIACTHFTQQATAHKLKVTKVSNMYEQTIKRALHSLKVNIFNILNLVLMENVEI